MSAKPFCGSIGRTAIDDYMNYSRRELALH